jgi:uncharacterized lipoprotein YajG
MLFKGKIHKIVKSRVFLFALFFMIGSILLAGCSGEEQTATTPVPETVEPVLSRI